MGRARRAFGGVSDKFRAIVDAKAKKLTMRTDRERLLASGSRPTTSASMRRRRAQGRREAAPARREHEFKEARRKVRTEELRARPCRGWNFCRRAKGSGLEAGGWQLLHDPNEKRLLDAGDFVMCHKQVVDDRGVKTPAAIASAAYVKERVHEECYTVAFDTKMERTDVRRRRDGRRGPHLLLARGDVPRLRTVPRESRTTRSRRRSTSAAASLSSTRSPRRSASTTRATSTWASCST